jgi:mRNA-degrading endonuclease toxin of MazEF toxin-antitoxin module
VGLGIPRLVTACSEVRLDWSKFGLALSGEPAGRRPAVVVSNDGANSTAGAVMSRGHHRGAHDVRRRTPYTRSRFTCCRASGLDRDSRPSRDEVRVGRAHKGAGAAWSVPDQLLLDWTKLSDCTSPPEPRASAMTQDPSGKNQWGRCCLWQSPALRHLIGQTLL